MGGTKGYKNHPQLARFRAHPQPGRAIAAFLTGIAEEAGRRGYHFDASKISGPTDDCQIEETSGQLLYEWAHLKAKLRTRAPEVYRCHRRVKTPDPHPLFRIVAGSIRQWEIVGRGRIGRRDIGSGSKPLRSS
jgi:hypothetical protein